MRKRCEGRRAKRLTLLVPERESYCKCLDFSDGWSAMELISTLMTIQHSYPLGDWSINWSIFLWVSSLENRITYQYYMFCNMFLFFLFSFISSVIHSTFLNCLAVAKKVIGRTHTLNGTTVEISRHSITDEFQAKDGSGDQVRHTTEPFKLGLFHILASVLVVKFYLTLWRKYLLCLMYLSWSCSPVLSSFKDYLKMQRKTLF